MATILPQLNSRVYGLHAHWHTWLTVRVHYSGAGGEWTSDSNSFSMKPGVDARVDQNCSNVFTFGKYDPDTVLFPSKTWITVDLHCLYVDVLKTMKIRLTHLQCEVEKKRCRYSLALARDYEIRHFYSENKTWIAGTTIIDC